MRLATFEANGSQTFGIVKDTGFIDAGRHLRTAPLEGCAAAGISPDVERARIQAAGLRIRRKLLAATVHAWQGFLCPAQLRVQSSRTGSPQAPASAHRHRFSDCHVGPGQSLRKPGETTEFDFEGEVAVVIGRTGRRVPVSEAMDHVAGLTAYNDATPRDWMRHTRHFTSAKNFPSTASFGPGFPPSMSGAT
jgi:hypothetical protein